jgi:hypothetical protein
VIRGKNQIANNATVELKNVNPNGDNVVASNLINRQLFIFEN